MIFRCSDAKGWGLKCVEDIPVGALIDEYVGEIINTDEAERRGLIDQKRGITYLFDLDAFVGANTDEPRNAHWPTASTYCLDANYFGNVTHFINHSCRPNIASFAVMINNPDPAMHRIAFFAVRDIKAGEELVFDYAGHYYDNEDGKSKTRYKPKTKSKMSGVPNEVNSFFKCLCGEAGCKVYLFEVCVMEGVY